MFSAEPGALDESDIDLAQALADVATIGLLHERAMRDAHAQTAYLQTALHSRVLLEQAKGIVAEAAGLDMDATFHLLRTCARNHNCRLTDTAQDITRRALTVGDLAAVTRPETTKR
jgi:AmiR/NasT family two-component response regulator